MTHKFCKECRYWKGKCILRKQDRPQRCKEVKDEKDTDKAGGNKTAD